MVFAGSWHCSFGGSGAGGCSYSQWGATHAGADGCYDLLIDGGLGQSGGAEGGPAGFEDYRYANAHTGIYDNGRNGTWIRDGSIDVLYAWAETEAFYFMIVADETLPAGDLCIDAALDPVSGCADEPVGTFHVVGAQTWLLTYDGDCDGCGVLTVDGIDMGELCGTLASDWPD